LIVLPPLLQFDSGCTIIFSTSSFASRAGIGWLGQCKLRRPSNNN